MKSDIEDLTSTVRGVFCQLRKHEMRLKFEVFSESEAFEKVVFLFFVKAETIPLRRTQSTNVGREKKAIRTNQAQQSNEDICLRSLVDFEWDSIIMHAVADGRNRKQHHESDAESLIF